MEKLQTKKISKKPTENAKTNKKTDKKPKKNKKEENNYKIKQFASSNKKLIVLSFMVFVASFVLVLLSLANSKYFLFLNRPKFFADSNLLCVLMIFCLIINCFLPIFSRVIDFYKSKIEKNENQIKKVKNKKMDLSFANVLFICLFSISFLAKWLWLCVFVLFFMFAMSFVLLFKKRSKHIFVAVLINFLISILLLLSFYYIYLLN